MKGLERDADEPVGAPLSFASCENEYWVLAMQTRAALSKTKSQQVKHFLTWEVIVPLSSVCFQLFASKFTQLYAICAVNLFADDRDFLFDRQVDIIEELEVRWSFAA
jgi:hypothetical protein